MSVTKVITEADVFIGFANCRKSHAKDAETAMVAIAPVHAAFHMRRARFYAILQDNFEANQLHIDGAD